MKITEVHAFLMSYALPEAMRLPFWNGERTIIKRDAMLIRVKTNTGLTGYAPGPAHERAQKEIHEVIRPFLMGKDPRRWAELKFAGELEIAKTYRAVRDAIAPEAGTDVKFLQRAHLLLQTHGRDLCRAKPRCAACPLRDICDYGKALAP